uniref:Uncharacterized protein n=1 Tax=Fundulus heteroclitus TaxID=8078 RepID=A0A3Q2PGZ2_FUNHE
MLSCSASLGLLVLLGGVLACASPVRDKFVSDDLKKSHELIANKLGLTQLEVNKDPLFDFVIRTLNTSCQGKDDIRLMNATLSVYMRLFSKVLPHHNHDSHHDRTQTAGLLDSVKEPERATVLLDLKKLKKKMEELKNRLTCQNQNTEAALTQL